VEAKCCKANRTGTEISAVGDLHGQCNLRRPSQVECCNVRLLLGC
jgi:hypothetical protein